MKTLERLAKNDPRWSLDEFVEVVNQLLPQFLPFQKSHTRVREEITPRLVRHYTTQGMLDEPLKEGRYATYIYRHLLQMLVVRRLLAEGYGASAINDLAISKSNAELESLLQGGIQLTITTANPALDFLQQIQERSSVPKPPLSAPSPSPVAKSQVKSSNWTRIEIIPGLEIHLREDFVYPKTPQEQKNLIQSITQKLKGKNKK
ncbi:MerR family transcriptional regulator [Dapis sp. BLCC M126]|uniref:MerR family transcriptional regulator n=1 Tax=Dapis sp. BLCC M126 TaxID=3400189 RepID=UPI003CF5316B